jgi:polyhydroxybutyrate depolymerase
MVRILALLLTGIAALHVSAAGSAECSAGTRQLQVMSGGVQHQADLVLPAAIQEGKSVPLVIELHPSGGSGQSFDDDTGLTAAATAKGFAVMRANGAIRAADGGGYFWNIPGVPLVSGAEVPQGTRDDVRFLADAIDQAVKDHCIDARRVYVTGFSGGARMSSMLGCRLADRIAAIAPVAGLRAGRAKGPQFSEPDADDCKPSRAVRVLAIHGTDDRTNAFAGGSGGVRWGYSVERAAERWAQLNHCDGALASQKVATQVTRVQYGACGASSAVVLYRIDATEAEGGGHIWPGARGVPAGQLNATQVVLEFFARP